MSDKVKVYSTSSCPWCDKVKEFLKENDVEFDNINIGEDEQARNEMFEKSGQMGVPVTEIGDKLIVGFDKDALQDAIKGAASDNQAAADDDSGDKEAA